MHAWRKRVKDLRYAAEVLDVARARGAGRARHPKQAKGGAAGSAAGRLRTLARRADALGELLGEEHDLAVLAERSAGRRSAGGRHCASRRAHKAPPQARSRDDAANCAAAPGARAQSSTPRAPGLVRRVRRAPGRRRRLSRR